MKKTLDNNLIHEDNHYVDSEIDPYLNDIEIPRYKICCDKMKFERSECIIYDYCDDPEAICNRWFCEDHDFEVKLIFEKEYEADTYTVIRDGSNFLIVGNIGCHPFVSTTNFSFGNSDGSTNDTMIPKGELNVQNVMERAYLKADKFIRHQIH